MRAFLLEVLFDALLTAGKTPRDLHEYAKTHALPGLDNARLSDYGTGKRTPADLDRLTTAVAGLLGKRPITLWRRALTQWAEDPAAITLEARQAARRLAQDQLTRQARGRGRRAS